MLRILSLITALLLSYGCGGRIDETHASIQKELVTTVRASESLQFYGALKGYSITNTGNSLNLTFLETDGTTPLTNNVRLRFSDISYAFDTGPGQTGGAVYRLYQAAFNRSPDLGGLGYWISAIEQSGLSLNQVAQSFVDSPEFTARYGSLNDSEFVTQLYQNVLHRAPDASGFLYHVGYLASHPGGRAQDLVSFSESPENISAVSGRISAGFPYFEAGVAYRSSSYTAPPVSNAVQVSPIAALSAGDFVQLKAQVPDNTGRLTLAQNVAWTSSNKSVAAVTVGGLVMALGSGEVTITATEGASSGDLPAVVSANSKVQPGQVLFYFGPEETVYDFATQNCPTGYNTPDEPAHAIRLADSSILLFAANDPQNFAFRGAGFGALRPKCSSVLTSVDDRTPGSFMNRQWISGLYRQGGLIHALVHNEYHDPVAITCKPGDTSPGNPCWYNSVSYAVSNDDGNNFMFPVSSLVAAPNQRWEPPVKQVTNYWVSGYLNPTNVIAGPEGYFYAMVYSIPQAESVYPDVGACVMRTQTLGNPTSWRGWDGTKYNVAFTNPYTTSSGLVKCKPVIHDLVSSLTFNSYLQQYIAISGSCDDRYSLSSDLVNWTTPAKFRTSFEHQGVGANNCPPPTGVLPEAYPSLIDHDSTSDNFDTSGQTPYLYYSRWTATSGSEERNLIRQPVILIKSPKSGFNYTAPTTDWEFSVGKTSISGMTTLYPWAFDPVGISSVKISVDGTIIGSANGPFSRPDVAKVFSNAPVDCGYQFKFDSSQYSKGVHTLTLTVTNNAQITTIKVAQITIF